MLASWKESYEKPRQHIEKQRHLFANKGPHNHVQVWELDSKRRLSTKELMLSNCGAREDSQESFGQQGLQGTTEDEMVRKHHWLNEHELWEIVKDRAACAVVHSVAKSWTWLSNWTEVKWGIRCHYLSFLNVKFQASSFSSFTIIKRLFSSSLLSAIRVVSSAYIWGCLHFSWQSWFQLVLHPAQHFSWCTMHIS